MTLWLYSFQKSPPLLISCFYCNTNLLVSIFPKPFSSYNYTLSKLMLNISLVFILQDKVFNWFIFLQPPQVIPVFENNLELIFRLWLLHFHCLHYITSLWRILFFKLLYLWPSGGFPLKPLSILHTFSIVCVYFSTY